MIKPEDRPFVWDKEEASLQQDAVKNLEDTADEYNIRVMYISGNCFVSHCDDNDLPTIAFTVGQYNQWLDNVTDRMKEMQIQIESEEFLRMVK